MVFVWKVLPFGLWLSLHFCLRLSFFGKAKVRAMASYSLALIVVNIIETVVRTILPEARTEEFNEIRRLKSTIYNTGKDWVSTLRLIIPNPQSPKNLAAREIDDSRQNGLNNLFLLLVYTAAHQLVLVQRSVARFSRRKCQCVGGYMRSLKPCPSYPEQSISIGDLRSWLFMR